MVLTRDLELTYVHVPALSKNIFIFNDDNVLGKYLCRKIGVTMKTQTISSKNSPEFFQKEVSALTQKLSQNPFLLGSLVKEMKDPLTNKIVPITLSTTPKNIPHSLGTASQGWIIINQSAPASVYEHQPTTDDERKAKERESILFTKLVATGDVTVVIWFF